MSDLAGIMAEKLGVVMAKRGVSGSERRSRVASRARAKIKSAIDQLIDESLKNDKKSGKTTVTDVHLSPQQQLELMYDKRGRIREDAIRYPTAMDGAAVPNELIAVEYLRRKMVESTSVALSGIMAQFAGTQIPIDAVDVNIRRRLKRITKLCFDILVELLESNKTPSRVKYRLVMDVLNYFYPKAQEVRISGSGPNGSITIQRVLDPQMRDQISKIATSVALAMAKAEVGVVVDVEKVEGGDGG